MLRGFVFSGNILVFGIEYALIQRLGVDCKIEKVRTWEHDRLSWTEERGHQAVIDEVELYKRGSYHSFDEITRRTFYLIIIASVRKSNDLFVLTDCLI